MEYLDSSDDDEERIVLKKIKESGTSGYLDYYSNMFGSMDEEVFLVPRAFQIKLGLFLHNFADRFLRSSYVDQSYKQKKEGHCRIETDKYSKMMGEIEASLRPILVDLFDITDVSTLTSKDYVHIFNFAFNLRQQPHLGITLKSEVSYQEAKNQLKKSLITSGIDLKVLNKHSGFVLKDTDSGEAVLALQKLAVRSNKNKIKFLTLQEVQTKNSSITFTMPTTKLEHFDTSYVMRPKSGKITAEIPEFGAYDKVISRIPRTDERKKDFVKYVLRLIRNDLDNSAVGIVGSLEVGEISFAEQFAHLLFLEMQRNVSSIFMGPIFLELVERDSKNAKTVNFPMAMKEAVAQTRGAILSNESELPYPHILDYGDSDGQTGDDLLQNIGHVLTKWLDSSGITLASEVINLILVIDKVDFLLRKSDDTISVIELEEFIETLQKIEGYQTKFDNLLQDIKALYGLVSSRNIHNVNYSIAKKKLVGKFGSTETEIINKIQEIYKEFSRLKSEEMDILVDALSKSLPDKAKQMVHPVLCFLCTKLGEWYGVKEVSLDKIFTSSDLYMSDDDAGKSNLGKFGPEGAKFFTEQHIDKKQKREEYIKIANSGGGDCAVYAVMHALYGRDCDVERQLLVMRNNMCGAVQNFISLYSYVQEVNKKKGALDTSKLVDLYKAIFVVDPGFEIFQRLSLKKLKVTLESSVAEDNQTTANVQTQKDLGESIKNLNDCKSWNDLAQNSDLVSQIFRTCNTFDIDANAAIADHDLDPKSTPKEYYDYASKPTIWLNNSEISAYLLTLGYSLEKSEQYGGGTAIEFKNDEGKSIFLYSDGQDSSASTTGQGTHWEACTKIEEAGLKGSSSILDTDIGNLHKYWGKYTLDGIIEILNLRIDNADLKGDVLLLEGRFIDEKNQNILDLIRQIVLDDSGKIILVPLNLFNKHAVGLVFEKCTGDTNTIKITYIDPSNEEMPAELKDLMHSILTELCPGVEVVIRELHLETQKYANCGPEVIENFIYYLTGARMSQEEAIELHSTLMERKLHHDSGIDIFSTLLEKSGSNEDFLVSALGIFADVNMFD